MLVTDRILYKNRLEEKLSLIRFFLSTVSKVMISSGLPFSSSTRTEIIDVIDAGTTCPELAKFPVNVESAVGANLQGVPIICGGWLGKQTFARVKAISSQISLDFDHKESV